MILIGISGRNKQQNVPWEHTTIDHIMRETGSFIANSGERKLSSPKHYPEKKEYDSQNFAFNRWQGPKQ